MVIGGHARMAAWAAAGILFAGVAATGCGDGGGGNEEPSPTQTQSETREQSPTGNRPADPAAAEKEIRQNWQTFFSADTPLDEKTKFLENGGQLQPLLQAFSGDARARQVGAEVEKVTFTSPTGADVTYTLTLQGATALPDARGSAVEQDSVWKVSVKTLCGLVQMSGSDVQAPGC
ncbi:hypothetical protein [Streptomyces sp. NPDC051776]|uniref:hypothetical protein n=1 Tax=Streptomyces sp. NPDC051776 TaxID=3155414 RepID=UPI00341C8F38